MLGRFRVGQTAHLYLACVDGSDTPAAPDDVPLARVYAAAGLVEAVRLPARDRYTVTGLFHLPLFLGAGYGAGPHTVLYEYAVAGTAYARRADFEVLPGGDADGHLHSMYFYRRPHADFVVYATEAGRVRQGRNPGV